MSSLRSALVVGAALAGLALSTPAMAVQPFNPGDFKVLESLSGGSGKYTVVNNSTDWYIYGFQVSNPEADFAQAYTNRPFWNSGNCGSGCGNVPFFSYFNEGGPFDFDDNIQPGETDGRFGFYAPPASTYTIFLVDSNFVTTTTSGQASGTPEPGTWSLMIGGFGLAGAALRRRRLQPARQKT